MIIAVRMQICILLCICSISTHLTPANTYLQGIGADLCIANLCLNGTHLIPAITLLRGIGAGLCGEPACFESYDALGTNFLGDLFGQHHRQATSIESYDTLGTDIVGDLCLKSIIYSTNQRCITSGLGG